MQLKADASKNQPIVGAVREPPALEQRPSLYQTASVLCQKKEACSRHHKRQCGLFEKRTSTPSIRGRGGRAPSQGVGWNPTRLSHQKPQPNLTKQADNNRTSSKQADNNREPHKPRRSTRSPQGQAKSPAQVSTHNTGRCGRSSGKGPYPSVK
jgi:hypothetical protein